MAPGQSLIFYGKLIAVGTQDKPIRFLPMKSGQESWGSLVLQGKKATGSRLKHFEVSGGSVLTHKLVDYSGQINIHDVDSFEISHCLISDNAIGDDAMHIAYSQGTVDHCKFVNSHLDALDVDISSVSISHSEFRDSGNDAIDMMNSHVEVKNGVFLSALDKCFSIGEQSTAPLTNITLSDCHVGIAVKDGSFATVNDILFKNKGDTPIHLYQKNPRYKVGGRIVGNNLFGVNDQDIMVTDKSENLLSPTVFQPPTASNTHPN